MSESLRPDSADFTALFLQDTPFIDTRAPIEFKQGSFPNAVNLPLMSDEEREQVGTCYKQQGQDEAIKLGHELVAGEIKNERVQAWVDFAKQHPEGYLYCFRGGLRSQICQQWMGEAGAPYPRITGGYKAMRRFLIDTMEDISKTQRLVVLAGHTGSAKTEIIKPIANCIDLEALANHLGSAFGKRVDGQPSQIDFENRVAVAMLRHRHQHQDLPIVLEDESQLIGRCALPQPLLHAMEQAPLVVVDVPLEERVEHTFKNYILIKLDQWQQAKGEEAGFAAFAEELRDSFYRIRRRLGGERYKALCEQLEAALDAQKSGDNSLHRSWIRSLLDEYYGPLYEYQLDRRADRIIFRGDTAAVSKFLAAYR